jgi:hypothetical protein
MNSVKIFTVSGNQQVAKLEGDINEWLQTLAADVEVKLTDVVLDRVSNNQTGGEDRRLTILVWTGQR